MIDEQRLLLDRLLEDDLADDQRDAAMELLARDPQAVAYYAQQSLLLTDLRQSLKRRSLQKAISEEVPAYEATFTRERRPLWAAALAAGLLLAVMLVLPWDRTVANRNQVAVHVIKAQGTDAESMWQTGRDYLLQHLTITSGQVALRLMNGVTLDFTGPASGEFKSPQELHLSYGAVVADVGDEGKGFVIQTAKARVVDQGTRFGVSISETQAVDVVVLQGLVDVYTTRDTATPITSLTEGQGIRVDESGAPQQVKMVRLGPDARFLENRRADDLVRDVSDDLADEEPTRFYGIVRGAMREGVRVYTNGMARTWHALESQEFPAELLGADVICTNSIDRKRLALTISIEVTRPCDLYVMPDARNPIPEWILDDYQDTGHRLECGSLVPVKKANGTIVQNPLTLHAVYKRRIASPGIVQLGPPRAKRGEVKGLVMYGVAVKPVP
jgi:hypothetical protein